MSVTEEFRDFEEYARKLAEQSREHGRGALSPKDDPVTRLIGFESPEGWFVVPLVAIRDFCARERFEKQPGPVPGSVKFTRWPHESKIIAIMKTRLTLAYDGDPPGELRAFNQVMEKFRAG